MKTNRGQSLLEAILALAIFALIVSALAAMTIGGYQGLSYGTDYLEAGALADEAIEAARSVRDGAWNEFTFSSAIPSVVSSQWQLNNGMNEVIGKFTRTLTFTPVCRDGAQNVVTCPGSSTDLHSKLASTTVTWQSTSGVMQEVKREAYLTNWDSREWVHTDWTGLTGTNVNVGIAGQLQLAGGSATWATTTNTGSQTWNDVYMFSDTDGFAVGSGGSIRRWNNPNPNVWNVMSSGTLQHLNSIHCSALTNCFAAGAQGIILRWDGNSWLPIGSGSWDTGRQTWNKVWTFGPASGFVAGAAGFIWRHNGANWVLSQDTGSQTWNALWMFSPTDGIVTGSAGEIRRYNGATWPTPPAGWDTGSQTWNDIYMFSTTDGVVVGNGGLSRRLISGNWNSAVTTGVSSNINGIHLTSASTGWAVGSTQTGELILSWNGSAFSRVGPASNLPDIILSDVFCLSVDSCFASGASGNVFRLSGGGFQTTGSLISPAFDMSDNSPVQIINWDQSIPGGCVACTVRFQLRNGSSATGPWSIWRGPDGTSSTYFTAAAGALVPTLLNTQRFIQYQVFLDGNGLTTPVVDAVNINYK